VAIRLTLGDRLGGIHQEVDEDVPEPRLVREDRRRAAVLLHEPRAVTDLVARHPDRELEDALDVERRLAILAGARERGQPAHDVADPVHGRARLGDDRLAVALLGMLGEQIEVRGDRTERVVDLVGHAARERADRDHAIGEHEPRCEIF
jgi:hypothetical protein